MKSLQALQAKCKELGCVKGESAEDFRKRDAEGARKLAEFIASNMRGLTKGIAGAVCAS